MCRYIYCVVLHRHDSPARLSSGPKMQLDAASKYVLPSVALTKTDHRQPEQGHGWRLGLDTADNCHCAAPQLTTGSWHRWQLPLCSIKLLQIWCPIGQKIQNYFQVQINLREFHWSKLFNNMAFDKSIVTAPKFSLRLFCERRAPYKLLLLIIFPC